MADLENNVAVTPQPLFRLVSVSKPITAVAARQLWERHQFDLDAPAQKYCPSFPQKEFLLPVSCWDTSAAFDTIDSIPKATRSVTGSIRRSDRGPAAVVRPRSPRRETRNAVSLFDAGIHVGGLHDGRSIVVKICRIRAR